jgi:hypothetical protein
MGPFFKFLVLAPMIYKAKRLFPAVNASLCWLNNVSGVYLPGFFDSYWSAGFRTFLQVLALASHWLEDCANCTPTPEKMSNTAPTTLSAVQAASQSTFINAQLYCTCDKW